MQFICTRFSTRTNSFRLILFYFIILIIRVCAVEQKCGRQNIHYNSQFILKEPIYCSVITAVIKCVTAFICDSILEDIKIQSTEFTKIYSLVKTGLLSILSNFDNIFNRPYIPGVKKIRHYIKSSITSEPKKI